MDNIEGAETLHNAVALPPAGKHGGDGDAEAWRFCLAGSQPSRFRNKRFYEMVITIAKYAMKW